MSRKTTLFTVIIAAVLLLAVVAIAMNTPDKKTDETATTTTETTQPSSTTTETQPTSDEQQATATIMYTDSGFEPSTLTVKSGDTVRIENKSSMALSLNSDDHPSHTKQSELNVGDVPQGGSREFTVTKVGTWGYHNHNNASHTGKLIAE